MVETLIDSEKLLSAINVFAEVNVIDLINIAFVHVTLHKSLQDVLRGGNPEQIKHSQELILCHMTILSDIVVLEHRLQVNTLVFNGCSVFFKDVINLGSVLSRSSKVLSASQKSVILGDSCNSCRWSLVNSLNGECSVDICNEVFVAEEALWVCSLILLGQSLELVISEREIHRGKDGFELGASDSALSQLVKVSEKFFNSDSFHHNCCLETILNIVRVVRYVNVSLSESRVDHINVTSVSLEEG